MREELLTKYDQCYITAHYHFHYRKDTKACRDILSIADGQEACFDKITRELGVTPGFPIHYYLVEDPAENGLIYGDDEPCNGFASLPDKVFAVYNDTVSCLGEHEDTHVIAAIIDTPDSAFIREGLAMYMDEAWQGETNEALTRKHIESGRYRPVGELLNDDLFYDTPESVSYPTAGAFTRFCAGELSMDKYLKDVYASKQSIKAALEAAFGMSMDGIEKRFSEYIRS